ncbi:MAG: 3-deoxy-D-manno-octulosonic acid transferase, partial [Caldimonas sp.]
VETLAQGVARAAALAISGAQRDAMAVRASRFAAAHRGAAKRMAERVLDLLPPAMPLSAPADR